jgi:hypothetical protein
VTTRRAFKQLSDLLRQSPRTLVPVLGSGFVTQAVLSGAAVARRSDPPRSSPAPVDWVALLKGVASEFECEAALRHIHADVPGQTTLLWDAMVAELARRAGPRSRGAHVWEARMRRSVAKRLREDVATRDRARPFVDSFLRLGWDDVLTFNFDSVLLPRGATPKARLRGEASRASLGADVRTDAGPTRVWFPHGHLSDEASIVLGAHAYGVRIAAMQAAFDAHALRKKPRPTRDLPSWVATVLERPLLFVGLSLTREEWTIWWLLSQRARFLARREGARPAAFVFARRPASAEKLEAHASFQTLARACDLLGLTLLSFDDFKLGWRDLRQALGW